ncbi:hypothetical protein [Stutzerimonas xanthomarina]|uniref:hypothetical protein n=1 Tax=Stutzerimonas xanthomarina TaxID=271420 RepID=UPI003AA9264A
METLNADIPLAADHFQPLAGCIRAQEGTAAEIDEHTAAYHFHEPLGVVGRLSRGTSLILMAAWNRLRHWRQATRGAETGRADPQVSQC